MHALIDSLQKFVVSKAEPLTACGSSAMPGGKLISGSEGSPGQITSHNKSPKHGPRFRHFGSLCRCPDGWDPETPQQGKKKGMIVEILAGCTA